MAPKGQKRGAEETKKIGGAKKSRANKDPTTAAIEKVINGADLPASCREMLLMGISPSLETPSETRHEIQKLMVTMIEELIQESETRLQAAVEAAQVAESNCQATKSVLASKLSDSDAIHADKTRIVEDKSVTLAIVGDKVDNTSAVVAEKQELQRTGDAKMQETQDLKASVHRGLETDYVKIIDGAGDCSELLVVLKQINADDSLLQALPSTCAKAPGDRGAFDTMVLNQLEASLKKKLEELLKVLEAETPGVEERAAAVGAADQQLADAKAEQVSATEDHAAADAQRIESASVVAAAKAELKTHEPAMRAATKTCVQAVAALENFQQNTRTPFELLRDSSDISDTAVVSDAKVAPMETEREAAVTVGGA